MQQKVVAGVAVIALILGGLSLFTSDKVTERVVEKSVGAVPVLNSPLEITGVKTHYLNQSFVSGTSTSGRLKTPSATSTGMVWCNVNASVSYAVGFQLAFASLETATTTNLGFISLAAGAGDQFIIATSTVFPPLTNINLKVATSSGTTVNANFAPTGSCKAILSEVR